MHGLPVDFRFFPSRRYLLGTRPGPQVLRKSPRDSIKYKPLLYLCFEHVTSCGVVIIYLAAADSKEQYNLSSSGTILNDIVYLRIISCYDVDRLCQISKPRVN